jgi:hypothetical protein
VFGSSSTPSSLVAGRVSAPYCLAIPRAKRWASSRKPRCATSLQRQQQRGEQRSGHRRPVLDHLRTGNDRVVLATAKRRPAASRVSSPLGAASWCRIPRLLIFECTMLTFVPPDPIIVYPKSCLYPSLHIRRPFPSSSSSSYPLHIPQAYPKCILEKQLGGSSLFQIAGPEIRPTSSRQGRKPSRRALSDG